MGFLSENNRKYFRLCVLRYRVPGDGRERVVTEGEGPVWFKLCVLRSTPAETVRKQI